MPNSSSHKFIEFPPDLRDISAKIWLLLGEVQSKCQYSKSSPIPPLVRDHMQLVSLSKGIHGTTSIEGNTFSEEEIQKIIKNTMDVPLSRQYQKQQIDNMINAFNQVAKTTIFGTPEPFSVEKINQYQAWILENLEDTLQDHVVLGEIRKIEVVVGNYKGAPAIECEQMLTQLCNWLNEESHAPEGYEIAWQILKSLIAHVYIAWIHPYGDGNGRTARLVEFAVLLRAGVPDIAAHLLSNFYNETRDMYYKNLQESHGDFVDGSYPEHGSLIGFIEYALQGFKDELDRQMKDLHLGQLQAIWHDFIHISFPNNPKQVELRRKRLILDMSDNSLSTGLFISEIRNLSPSIAVAYNKKTDKTIQRDLEKLIDMDLIVQLDNKFSPNVNLLLGFYANARIKSENTT